MTGATHYAFSYLIVSASGAPPAVALPASLLSLLPDIDHPGSLMGRLFPRISARLQKKFGHRGLFHSLCAVLAVSVLLIPLYFIPLPPTEKTRKVWYLSCVLAYASHIFIDLFNRSGVKLLAPFSRREYVSSRNPALRIYVSSRQEKALFALLVLLSIAATGQTFSIHRAVRSASRVFYHHYDGALKDFQDNSAYICDAKVKYFNHVSRQKRSETLQVLAMFPEKAFLLRGEERIILRKDQIDEIEIFKTSQKVSHRSLSGSSLEELAAIPAGSHISGTITIQGYVPDIKNSDCISIEKGVNTLTLVLTCVAPGELREVCSIDRSRQSEIEALRRSLCAYRIARLKEEFASINRKTNDLVKKGYYENYGSIMKLYEEQKKIESRIDTLKMHQVTGADEKVLQNLKTMTEKFSVFFELYIHEGASV